MEIPSSGVYLLIAAICFAVTVQVALASGRLRVTLIRYEFLYYGRQPTRTSTLAATQPTVAAPSSTESVSPPPSDVISDVATDTPRDAGDVRGPLHRETDSEEPSTTQELSFPWQQETVCNTTSPPRPRYRFLLCVDYSDPGVPNPSPCQLERLETDALPARAFGEGRDVVTFPLVLSSTSSGQLRLNPETVAFNHWPGTLRVSVFVTCCGVSHDYTGQCQETLTHIIAGEPAPSGTQSQPRTVLLQGHGRLMLRMVLECDEGFYGPACNVPCRVDTPGIEHAVCNVTTGQKECMAGWEGPGCQTDTDECRLSLCHNGAVCVNSPPGSFTCKCPLGTGGRLCESRVQVCHLRPCLNGATCLDSAFGFVCFCRPGFSGYQCETVLATQGGSDIMPVHNVGQPLPVSSIQHDGSLLVGGGGNTEAQSQEQVSTWHAWYIVLIVIAFIVITSLAVIGCVIIKGRKEYKISGRRPLYSFRWTARVLKRTVRRKRKTQLRDEGGDEDQRPYIVHLHRTDNSPGDDGEEDKYPNIVHLHRQQTINTNDSDKDLPGVARWLDDAKPRSDLDPLSGSSESARQRHVTMINQPSCRIRSMEVGVQEYCLQDDENDDGHYEDFVLENRDYGRKTEPCPHAFDEADGCCVFDNFNDNYLDAAFDDRFKQVYTIGGTMTLEELHVKSFKTRNPKRTARTLESLSTSSPAAATATTASFLPDVEAVQGSRVQARRVRRVDSAGYEVPQLIRPLADVRRSEGGYASLDDYHHLVTMPRDLVNDAGSDTASLLELGVCTAVPPPRDER